jgi:DNA-binding NarL/FixJ family response regulator
MQKTNTILLVDDHIIMRSGCRELLSQSGFTVVGEAVSGEEACQLYPGLQPDVVLMDLTMAGMGGLETIRRIVNHDNNARIIVLTMHDDPGFASRSIKNGAKGFVTKTSPPEILVQGIREVIKGGSYFSPDIAQKLATGSIVNHANPLSKLSNREFDIFTLLVDGYSTFQIAQNLSLTQKTVSNYMLKIKQKLEVKSVAEMVRMAINYGVDKQNVLGSDKSSVG